MRVLLCHSFYQQQGGEDRSFAHERDLLRARGHDVHCFTRENRELEGANPVSVATRTVWNATIHRELGDVLRSVRPEVMHCTNTFPLLSPAVYYAASAEGVPVVQSLRNYRVACLRSDFHRDGAVCEACKGRSVAWQGLRYRCYRDSLGASATVAAMQTLHRWAGTWTRKVDRYVALTEASRARFIECGLPADRISVKPNFMVEDPGAGDGSGGFALFVGRLSSEKGVDVLLRAWREFGLELPLEIVGDGPLADEVAEAAAASEAITWRGPLPEAAVLERVGEARCLVMPSTCFENFPRTILEAFSKGTPVIASRLGAMAELVEPPETGLHFRAGDHVDLARAVRDFLALPESELREMRAACRARFLERYSADANYRALMEIYRSVTRAPVPEPSAPAPAVREAPARGRRG